MSALKTLFLAVTVLVACQARNLIREKREARLRKKRMADESSEMPSGSPVSGSYYPSGYHLSGSYPSGGPVSGYFSGSDWVPSVPSEEPSEEKDRKKDPVDDSTFKKVAHQIASVFQGMWADFKRPENDDAARKDAKGPQNDDKARDDSKRPRDDDKARKDAKQPAAKVVHEEKKLHF